MYVLASIQLFGIETRCPTSDLHHQWCRVTPVSAPLEISWSCALYVTWWLWSSGIGLDIGSSEREILLGYYEPRHNWPTVIGAMLQRVTTQVSIHIRGHLLPKILWTCCVLFFWRLTHQEMVKRTSWYWLMPSPSSARPSLLTTRRHLPSPRS